MSSVLFLDMGISCMDAKLRKLHGGVILVIVTVSALTFHDFSDILHLIRGSETAVDDMTSLRRLPRNVVADRRTFFKPKGRERQRRVLGTWITHVPRLLNIICHN